jgi:hypothetical protein
MQATPGLDVRSLPRWHKDRGQVKKLEAAIRAIVQNGRMSASDESLSILPGAAIAAAPPPAASAVAVEVAELRAHLVGKFARLRAELVEAHSRRRDAKLMERLMDDLAETRREIAQLQSSDEQTGDSGFTLGW